MTDAVGDPEGFAVLERFAFTGNQAPDDALPGAVLVVTGNSDLEPRKAACR